MYIALQETHTVQENMLNKTLQGKYKWTVVLGDGFASAAIGVRSGIPAVAFPISSSIPIVGLQVKYPKKMVIISAYIPCNTRNAGDLITNALADCALPILFMGDVNGHHTKWGSPTNNAQGTSVYDAAENLDISVLNDGSSTFCRGNADTAIDVTFASACLFQHTDWKINDDPLGSDHYPIFVTTPETPPIITRRRQRRLRNRSSRLRRKSIEGGG